MLVNSIIEEEGKHTYVAKWGTPKIFLKVSLGKVD